MAGRFDVSIIAMHFRHTYQSILAGTVLLLGVLAIAPPSVHAVDCTRNAGGNVTISSSCSFGGFTDGANGSRYIDGADTGTGSTNTASITISSGVLTVNANQTIAAGSFVPTGGSIAIAAGGILKPGTPIWIIDADADGYANDFTSYAQSSTPSNGRRRNTLSSLSQSDCNDASYGLNLSTWYLDADSDGKGRSSTTQQSCAQPGGYVANSTDCNDDNSQVSISHSQCYTDADGDTYTNGLAANTTCLNSADCHTATRASTSSHGASVSNYAAGTLRNGASASADCNDGAYSAINSCGPLAYGDGHDGAVTISASTNINSTNLISGRSCSQGGDAVNYSVTGISGTSVTLSATPASGCLTVGDEIILINLQGVSSAYTNTGTYELALISGISGNVITLSNVNKYYGTASNQNNIGTSISNQRVMLQRVPNYTNVTVNNTLYATAWNGTRNGVLAFKATGTVYVNTGVISMYARGYRAGAGLTGGESYCGNPGGGNTSSGTGGCGGGGGGSNAAAGGAGGGSYGGGGGAGGAGSGGFNRYNTGGGGGGAGGAGGGGGGGGNGYVGGSWGVAGGAGTSGAGGDGTYTGTNIGAGGGGGGGGKPNQTILFKNRLYMGSGGAGGGSGEREGAGYSGQTGGAGGGIILIHGATITISGTNDIYAHAAPGTGNGGLLGGAGGGGGGGTIALVGNTVTLASTGILSTGGAGGAGGGTYQGGAGGAGGNGAIGIKYYSSISGSTNPAYSAFTPETY